jgi:DtxR family Mn-dependent transcriptional regulator
MGEQYPQVVRRVRSVHDDAGTLIAMAHPGEHHPAFEEYCECMFEMREENAEIIQVRLAERLGVSRASVSEMVKRMDSEGLVSNDSATLALTAAGEKLAQRVVRRHRLAERFLTDMLGLDWGRAHHEACKWEHIISDDVEAALARVLGNPATCPHGNPIPGSEHSTVALTPLGNVEIGGNFVVERIPEILEEKDGLLDFLQRNDVVPGRRGTVLERMPNGRARIRLADRTASSNDGTIGVVELDELTSDRLLVTR